jgi:hypothetical protein
VPENTIELVSSGFITLDPKRHFDLEFRADRGPVEIEVLAKRAIALGPPVGPPNPPPPPPLSTDGGIRILAIPPGAVDPLHLTEQQSSGSGPQLLRFDVQPDQEGHWICRCVNIINQTRRCRAIVRSTRVVDVTAIGTDVSLRLLNRTLATLVRALSPRIALDDEVSILDISPEAKRFLGGTFQPITFDSQATNLRLDFRSPRIVAINLPTGGGSRVPALAVDLNFVPRLGNRGKLRGKVDVTNVRIRLVLTLRGGGDLGSRQLFPNADVFVDIDDSEVELFDVPPALGGVNPLLPLTDDLVEEFLEHVLDPIVGGSDASVIDQVRETIELKIRRPEVLHPLGEFITEALRQLVERDDVFHDVLSVDGNWRVELLHKDTPASRGTAPPDGPVVDVPPQPPPGSVGPAPPDGPVAPSPGTSPGTGPIAPTD